MSDQEKRRIKTVSTSELKRRWKTTREIMAEKNIDYLVMQTSEEFMGGTARWFSDFTARHQFPMTVIFPLDEDMTVINCGSDPPAEQAFPPAWAARGIKNRLGGVYFNTISYTSNIEAELAAGVLKKKKRAVIGLVERSSIPLGFYEELVKQLPEARFVDATAWVDELQAIKSPEEIRLIKETAALQDAGMAHLKSIIQPGMKDSDIYSEAHSFLSKNGSQRGLVLVGSGPVGTLVAPDVYHFQNRTIQKNDQVSVLLEVNGSGGYYTEILRVFTVGCKPTQAMQDSFGVALEALEQTARRLVPDEDPKDIWDQFKAFMLKKGYFPPMRSFSHGQGLSLVERPNIRPDEPWKLKAGMNLSVHPSAVRKDVCTFVGNNFIIGPDGAEEIHKFPKEIVVV